MAAVWVALGFIIIIPCLFLLLKWNEIRYNNDDDDNNYYSNSRGLLPPGTVGWPIIGMTAQFLKQGPNFMKTQRARYGSFFKSHILGSQTVISMDPEVNRFILMNEGKGLTAGYPQSLVEILGKRNLGAVSGADHKRLRGLMLSLISPLVLKDGLIPRIDTFLRDHLCDWDGKTIDLQEKTNEMALLVAFYQVVSTETAAFYDAFRKEMDKLVLGTLSLPINFPGTNYRHAMQGRRNAIKMLRKVMEKRRASSMYHEDMLGDILRNNEDSRHNKYYYSSDEEMIDQIITILYSGYETVSKTTMMAVRYLHDHPKALQEIREEHLKVAEEKGADEPIGWKEYKSMKFTRAVILETMRLATIVNGVMRKTTDEIKLNGYTVPKGWRIYAYTRELNYDDVLYPEPFTFNPWRWMVVENSLESHSHFLLFGAGPRICPGKELGIAKISLFLHYFVTKYRWEEVGENKMSEFPRVEAANGLHIRVEKY